MFAPSETCPIQFTDFIAQREMGNPFSKICISPLSDT